MWDVDIHLCLGDRGFRMKEAGGAMNTFSCVENTRVSPTQKSQLILRP